MVITGAGDGAYDYRKCNRDEDQRVVGRGLFDAMCAQFPDKYIALI